MIKHIQVNEMKEAIGAFNKRHADVQAYMCIDPIECWIRFKMSSITASGRKKAAVQLVPFYKIEALDMPPKDVTNIVLEDMYKEFKPETSIDLYDAIDTASNFVNLMESFEKPWHVATAEELDAIKICLEAAKDKGGV